MIFYPTGGGTGLIGMWKAFAELAAIGFIGDKRPRMVAVQAEGCAPMVRAFEAGGEHATRFENAHTVASGIRVPQAIGDFLILRAVRESGGFAIAVSDEAIIAALDEVARAEGLLLCPESAATYAAYKQSLADGRVGRHERAVLFNCATGLKYPLPPVHRSARPYQGDRLREAVTTVCVRDRGSRRSPPARPLARRIADRQFARRGRLTPARCGTATDRSVSMFSGNRPGRPVSGVQSV